MSQPDLQLTSFYSTISQYANESLSISPVIVRLLCNFWPKTKIAKVRGLIYDGNCTNCRAVQLFAAIKSFALGQKIIDRKFARDFGTRRLNFQFKLTFLVSGASRFVTLNSFCAILLVKLISVRGRIIKRLRLLLYLCMWWVKKCKKYVKINQENHIASTAAIKKLLWQMRSVGKCWGKASY